MEPMVARKTWRTLEPIHGLVYFAPEASDAYAALGVTGMSGYFSSRSAPMGTASAELVIATFFNFFPDHVRSAMSGVWDQVTPAQLLSARLEAAGQCLRRAAGDEIATGPDLERAASLARVAAEAACDHLSGKPLFAAHAALPWPDEPLLVLWHAQSLLREFRGDVHIAAMTAEGIDGCEALVVHAATGEIPRAALQTTRAWPDDAWSAAVERLRARGHVDADGAFTEKGRASRQWVEDRTDEWSSVAYEPLGEAGCEELRALARPLARAAAGAFRLG